VILTANGWLTLCIALRIEDYAVVKYGVIVA